MRFQFIVNLLPAIELRLFMMCLYMSFPFGHTLTSDFIHIMIILGIFSAVTTWSIFHTTHSIKMHYDTNQKTMSDLSKP